MIAALPLLDYATVIRVEIFGGMRAGRSFTGAPLEGIFYPIAPAIAISVIGVACLMLLFVRKS